MIAQPRCPNPECDSRQFALASHTPNNANQKITLVHCVKCGYVVSALDYNDLHTMVNSLAKALNVAIPQTTESR